MTRVGGVGVVVVNPVFLHALHTSLHQQYILLHFLVNTTALSSAFLSQHRQFFCSHPRKWVFLSEILSCVVKFCLVVTIFVRNLLPILVLFFFFFLLTQAWLCQGFVVSLSK